MPANTRTRPTASVPPVMPPLLMPQPPLAPAIPPVETVDLMAAQGCAAFRAVWRGKEAKIVECPALRDAMPEFKTAYDVDPYAGVRGFDDSDWPVLDPSTLGMRRGGGMICFFWFRTRLTIPADAAGAKAVFRTNIDDYGEVWVNGEMPRAAGRPSPGCIQGFNMPNRVVLADQVNPGDVFEIAIFAINGPISAAPANFLFVREAKVELFR